MAEIIGKQKGKRSMPPRVDLTPMVDLGFLLITFFMFTTSLAKPKLLELQMPYKTPEARMAIPEESTVVVIPAAGHRYAWFRGGSAQAGELHWSSARDLRSVLMAETDRVKKLPAHYSDDAHKLHLIVHPDSSSLYEDMVRVLDEIRIADVPHYFIGTITADEAALVKKYREGV